MSRLWDVVRVRVPRQHIERAMEHLRRVGKQGCEGFALWVGTLDGSEFAVTHTIIPAQHAVRSPDGVCVVIERSELIRAGEHERREVWIV